MFSKPSFQNPYLVNIIMSKNYYTNNLYPFQEGKYNLLISFTELIRGKISRAIKYVLYPVTKQKMLLICFFFRRNMLLHGKR